MQEKCKNIRNKSGGVKAIQGVWKTKTKRPEMPKSPSQLIFIPVLQFARVSCTNLQLAHACIKTKTCNMKHVAFHLTIPMI